MKSIKQHLSNNRRENLRESVKWSCSQIDLISSATTEQMVSSFNRLHPDLENQVRETIDSYNLILIKEDCRAEDLCQIRLAALSERRHLWQHAATLIGKLASAFEAARDLIRDLSKEKKWNPRFVSLCCLTSSLPQDLLIDIVEQTLSDKSVEVRRKAVAQAEHFDLKSLVPQIENILEKEKSEKVKRSIKWHLSLLRDGHIKEIKENGDLHITMHRVGYSGKRFLKGTWEERSIEELVDETKHCMDSTWSKIKPNQS